MTAFARPNPTAVIVGRAGRASVALLVVIAITAGCTGPAALLGDAASGDGAGAPPAPAPALPDVVFAEAAPVVAALPDLAVTFDRSADAAWVADVSSATVIPERALRAYAAAALQSSEEDPACGMSWNLLAGIGQVESRHGFIDGSRLDDDGTAVPAIIGIPLDGVDTASVPDSDDGLLDGDESVDRAVGPMQLIPQSWRTWGTDADSSGAADPQDVDDAALAAARYLCRTGELSSPASWRDAVLSWNRSETYLRDVSSWAAFYREAAAS